MEKNVLKWRPRTGRRRAVDCNKRRIDKRKKDACLRHAVICSQHVSAHDATLDYTYINVQRGGVGGAACARAGPPPLASLMEIRKPYPYYN
ncbi:hypothetical protein EVAR_64067_1 [Eumeta japonica]|uniref:Uncharacterized protein n=1 Tax=Eumeta variegata TaxID=151549 RepID=A0A4C1ZFM7_EUMVA|nr:hypothetical protein EVAR_64067_1 [Eumeta japonica]